MLQLYTVAISFKINQLDQKNSCQKITQNASELLKTNYACLFDFAYNS